MYRVVVRKQGNKYGKTKTKKQNKKKAVLGWHFIPISFDFDSQWTTGRINKYNIGCEANPTKRKMVHYRSIMPP